MLSPDFSFEKSLWKRGFKIVGGSDEVGRGCFAGPIVAGCVVFQPDILNTIYKMPIRIDDSKKLNSKQREIADKWIRKNALAWGIGEISVANINRTGIAQTTKMAFRMAVRNANFMLDKKNKYGIDYLLLDAFYIPYIRIIRMPNKNAKIRYQKSKLNKTTVLNGKQLAIVKGDEKSFSIASASIIAKVYRDKMMISLSGQYKFKKYNWGKNKGYGTKEHRSAILEHGSTKYHRSQFVQTYFSNFYSSQARSSV
ncbi:MAG: Ribonuclease HII [Candidatus Woesebacteria bacterium GW2011_GWA1_37_7]|uniref:Ribonuclease n=1 Tax=Candidatus Woesebacteria bacterium GW2011_GWA1_37_7 TaxID=1618545 RepID=A0A0G0H3R6_9BACT|nr:MAG: Ribonuclease HII [Candidatus Woesebacteria bacterium GW2011_GWA1_37_7]